MADPGIATSGPAAGGQALQGRAVAAVLSAGMLFGTAGTAVALGPEGTTPLGVGTARVLLGGLVLLGVVLVRREGVGAVARVLRTWPGLLASACTAIYQVCFFAAVQATGVAIGTLVAVGSAPLLAGLFGRALNGTRLTRAWFLATGVCVTGLVLLAVEGLGGGNPLGVLLALVAGACAGGYNVLVKRLFDQGHQGLPVLTATFLLSGAVMLLYLVTQPMDWLATVPGVVLALYLGVATMAVANLLMAYGLRRLPPGPVTTLTLADPATATVLGVVVLHESLASYGVVGLVLLLCGLLLQGYSSARRGVEPHM